MGRSGCPTKGGNFFRQGVSLQVKKFELSFFVEHHPAKKLSSPVPWSQTIYRTCISNNFRQVLSNILLKAWIFNNTTMTYLEKLVGTKSLNTKQCPAGLSPQKIPHYLPEHFWETLGMRENPTQRPFTYFAIKSVFSSPWSSNIHLITVYKLRLCMQPLLLYYIFNFSLYIHMCYANFD